MALSLNTSLLSLLLFVMLAKNVVSQNTSFEINAFTNRSLILTYERNAFVPPDETYVRLVPAYGPGPPVASVGRVLYTAPVKLWDQGRRLQASFETTITLRITPYNSTNAYDGMTFFIVPVNSTTTTGGTGSNLGIYDALKPGSNFFTVEFDCIINPYYDPGYNHIGININSQRSQNYTRLNSTFIGQLVTARITYDALTEKISVVATDGSTTSTVSFAYNLRDLLPDQVQVGLSASTGSAIDATYFDVYTWHFNSTLGPEPDSNTYIKQIGYDMI